MPEPQMQESHNNFMERCIVDPEAMRDYPDPEQRKAFCMAQWEEGMKTRDQAGPQVIGLTDRVDLSFDLSTAPARKEGSRFRKEVIHVGTFRKGDTSFDVNHNALNHWAASHDKLVGAGVRVPILVEGHESQDIGQVDRLFVEGDKLIAEFSVDKEMADKVVSNDVSIYSPAEYKDKSGSRHARPITHVALTRNPVVKGMSAAVAMSEDAADQKSMKEPEPVVANQADAGLSRVAAALSLDEDSSVDDIIRAIGDRNTSHEPSAMVVKMARENYTGKLNDLARSGCITPAVRDKLIEATVGSKDQPMAMAADDATISLVDTFIEALGSNKPVALGSHTGPQALELSNALAGDDINASWKSSRQRLGLERSN